MDGEDQSWVDAGAQMRAYRQTMGAWLTMRRLAELMGVSHSVISAIERGQQRATANFCFEAAPYLRQPVQDLLRLWGWLDVRGRWLPADDDPPLRCIERDLIRGGLDEDGVALAMNLVRRLFAEPDSSNVRPFGRHAPPASAPDSPDT